jgi:hypothetical protein
MVAWYYWSKSDRGNGPIPLVDQPSAIVILSAGFCVHANATLVYSCTENGDGDGLPYEGAVVPDAREGSGS